MWKALRARVWEGLEMADGRMSVPNGEGALLTIPVEIDDIDAAWLAAALGSRLPAGVQVRSFSVETIGTGVGLMGLLYRVTVEYAGDGAGAYLEEASGIRRGDHSCAGGRDVLELPGKEAFSVLPILDRLPRSVRRDVR